MFSERVAIIVEPQSEPAEIIVEDPRAVEVTVLTDPAPMVVEVARQGPPGPAHPNASLEVLDSSDGSWGARPISDSPVTFRKRYESSPLPPPGIQNFDRVAYHYVPDEN